MVGPILLLAAVGSAPAIPASASGFRPTATVSAHATARVEILSGVKFGEAHREVPPSAFLRSASITEADGQVSPAQLLEFQ